MDERRKNKKGLKMKSYQEFCTINAKRLFEIIDQHGSLLKWRKEWDGQGASSLPCGSNGYYKGGNLFALLFAQMDNGFKSEQWLTFNQINKFGGKVLKGAKSEEVYFWALKDNAKKNPKTNESEITKQVIFKTYRVFNLEQTTLFEKQNGAVPQSHKCAQLLDVLNVEVSHYGNKAFFSPSQDVVVMPQLDQFTSVAAYEATLFHELTHWTGHESRLKRESMASYGTDKGRAEEELVAEIGSFFLATFFNVNSDIENHASYISSWKNLLNEKEVMRATNMATKAFHYLLEPLQACEMKKAA